MPLRDHYRVDAITLQNQELIFHYAHILRYLLLFVQVGYFLLALLNRNTDVLLRLNHLFVQQFQRAEIYKQTQH